MDDINLKLSSFYTPRNIRWIRRNISFPSYVPTRPKNDLCSTYFGRVYLGATYAAHFSSIDRSCLSSQKVNKFCAANRAKLLSVLFLRVTINNFTQTVESFLNQNLPAYANFILLSTFCIA